MQRKLDILGGYFTATKALALVAGIVIFILMLFVTADVIGRYLFNSPLPGSYEIPRTFMVILVFFALAYTELRGIHIRLMGIPNRLNPRWRGILNIAAYLIGVVLFGLITWLVWPWVWKSWLSKEYMEGPLRLVFYPARFAAAIGLSFLSVQFAIELVQSIGQLLKSGRRERQE